MIRWLLLCPYGELFSRILEGWVPVDDLGHTHGEWATACEYPEIWKPVVAYEGLYEVSSHGQVRSLDRKVDLPYPRTIPGRLRKLVPDKDGYLCLHLSNAKRQKHLKKVAHLVAEAFVGPRPYGHHVCHSDGDKGNNVAFNLRYDTPRGNDADKLRHGTRLSGERCPASKLTAAQVMEIRALKGMSSHSKIARRYGVTAGAVGMIHRGRTWASVSDTGGA